MKRVHSTLRFFGLIPTLAISAALLTGCYNPSEGDHNSVALGADLNFSGLQLRSVLIVTSGQNEPGRVLGRIFNTTATDIQVVLADSDEQLPVKIPAMGHVELDQSPLIFNSTQGLPGARAGLQVTAKGQQASINVPIQDGTFAQYRPYIPSASPSS